MGDAEGRVGVDQVGAERAGVDTAGTGCTGADQVGVSCIRADVAGVTAGDAASGTAPATRAISAARKITPAGEFFPCYLMGHAIRTEPATDVLSDLWAVALVLEVDGARTVWASVDLIGLERAYTDRLRARIAASTGAAVEAVHIGFVHTHAAPEYEEVSCFAGAGKGAVPGYMDWVAEQIEGAVDDALAAGLEPVEVFGARVQVEGFYSNRNGLDKPADKEVSLLQLRAADGHTVAGAFSFACHSTVLGPQNRSVSPDLAGWLASGLEARWGVRPVCLLGAAGDMSNRLCRQGYDAAELARVGDGVLAQLPDVCTEPLVLQAPRTTSFGFTRTFTPDPVRKRAQYDEIKRRVDEARTFDERKVYSSALRIAELGLAAQPLDLDLRCKLIDLGDVRIFTVPAELFARFGVRIKEALACAFPVCWCYCDYNVGYLGNREGYGASFETAASDIPMGTTEEIVDAACAFIAERVA